MSQERYGIRRFALLNTAGYSLGLPSFTGASNV